MGAIINELGNDLAEQFTNSLTLGAPLYFFHGQVRKWQGNNAIIAMTQTNPITITTVPGHTAGIGHIVTLSGISGMVEANGLSGVISAITGDVITISTIDATGFSSYAGGGVMASQITAQSNDKTAISEVRHSIISMKRITGDMMAQVVARRDWISGTVYSMYEPDVDVEGLNYYVTVGKDIFMCLDNAFGVNSTDQPTLKRATPTKYSDGYTWKHIQSITDSDWDKFANASWVPVRPTAGLQSAGSGVEAIKVTAQGSGYVHGDTVVIIGDGTGAAASIGKYGNSGRIDYITVTNPGKNYTWAQAYVLPSSVSSGTGALLKANVTPKNGYADVPTKELLASNIRFVVDVNGSESGRMYVGDVRSNGILRSPLDANNKPVFADDYEDFRTSISVNSNGVNFTTGDTVLGSVSGATGICAGSSDTQVDVVDVTGSFDVGEVITTTNSYATITSVSVKDTTELQRANILYSHSTGGSYTRNANQTDKWKVTLSL